MRSLMFALTFALANQAAAVAQDSPPINARNPLITASGTGEIHRAPDLAEITVGLQSRGSTPGGAATEIDRLLAVVRDSLRSQRIPDSALVVGVRSIMPTQTFPDRSITGYSASLSFSVRLRDLPHLPEVLDALAGAGATQISEVRYKSDDEDGVFAEAVAKAVAAATRDAQASARAAGGRLGAIVYLETGRSDQRFMGYHGYLPGMNSEARGQEAVSGATVTIYWRLEGR